MRINQYICLLNSSQQDKLSMKRSLLTLQTAAWQKKLKVHLLAFSCISKCYLSLHGDSLVVITWPKYVTSLRILRQRPSLKNRQEMCLKALEKAGKWNLSYNFFVKRFLNDLKLNFGISVF